jgi:hypothetical protein
MPETATLLLSEVKKLKDGVTTKGPWTLYGVIDGNDELFGTTFSESLYDKLKGFEGKKVLVEFEDTEKGRNIKGISDPPAESNGDTPALGDGTYIRGQTAPADKASINRAVALKAAVATLTHTLPSTAVATEAVLKIGPLCHAYEIYLNTGNWPQDDPPF